MSHFAKDLIVDLRGVMSIRVKGLGQMSAGTGTFRTVPQRLEIGRLGKRGEAGMGEAELLESATSSRWPRAASRHLRQ